MSTTLIKKEPCIYIIAYCDRHFNFLTFCNILSRNVMAQKCFLAVLIIHLTQHRDDSIRSLYSASRSTSLGQAGLPFESLAICMSR